MRRAVPRLLHPAGPASTLGAISHRAHGRRCGARTFVPDRIPPVTWLCAVWTGPTLEGTRSPCDRSPAPEDSAFVRVPRRRQVRLNRDETAAPHSVGRQVRWIA